MLLGIVPTGIPLIARGAGIALTPQKTALCGTGQETLTTHSTQLLAPTVQMYPLPQRSPFLANVLIVRPVPWIMYNATSVCLRDTMQTNVPYRHALMPPLPPR